MTTIAVSPRCRAVMLRYRARSHAFVWDLFWPLACLFLGLGLGAIKLLGAMPWSLALVPFLTMKVAHVRVDRDSARITWWWGPIPYRRRVYSSDGRFDECGDEWSTDAPSFFGYSQPTGLIAEDEYVLCRKPAVVTSFLNQPRVEPVALPDARIVPRDSERPPR